MTLLHLSYFTDKIQLSGNDANDFLNNPAGSRQQRRGITEECDEGCDSEEIEEYYENQRGNTGGWR